MNYHALQNFNDSKDFVSESGSPYHEDFVGKLDKDGNVRLVSVGKTDVYAEIQSHELETDINVLLKRAEAGDLSVFTSAVFGDFSDRPDSYVEMLNMVKDAEKEFNGLPQEIKDKFGNNFEKYIATAGTESWLRNFGVSLEEYKEAAVDQKNDNVEEVKE